MMEQEPVYVASDRLRDVCHKALGLIYDARKTGSTDYIVARTAEYNSQIIAANKRRGWLSVFGVRPKPLITPHGMEQMIFAEMQMLQQQGPEYLSQHAMCEINGQYSEMEHMAKDAMIQCAMNESVLVSADMARCISHLGIPLDFCKRRPIGFHP